MAQQDLEFIAGHTVGITIECIPSATNGIVDRDIAAGKATTQVEIRHPWICGGLDGAHRCLSGCGVWRAFQTYGDPAVESEVRIDAKKEAVDSVWCCRSKQGMVETGGGINKSGIDGIAGHR